MSDKEEEVLDIPEFEKNLPENTTANPSPTAFVVHNPNVTSRQVHLHSTSSHSVPVNLPPYPFPKEDFVNFSKNQPSKYNNNIAIRDEYLQTKFDPLGEKKISKNGFFFDHEKNERIVVSTFTLPGKGKKLYVMATDISKELQFRDSYLFLHKNKSLIKYIANEADKAFLIKNGILQSVFKSRTIGVVTFRSLFLIYGARLLKKGKRLADDYWEELGKNEGFTENDPVIHTVHHSSNNDSLNNFDGTGAGGSDSGGNHGDNYSKIDLKNINKKLFGGADQQGGLNNKLSNYYADIPSNVPIPVSMENHPFITNVKFKKYDEPQYRLKYPQRQYLDNLLLAEPSNEVKQNYLLSSGITNSPILSKPLITFNANGQIYENNSAVITSPGGSVPSSITSSLLNNENLISSNGDNIYYVSCLQGQGIAGAINLSKNIVSPNYRLPVNDRNETDKTKLEELLNSIPLSNSEDLIGKKSNVGLKFYQVNNVIEKVINLQKDESLNNTEETKQADSEPKPEAHTPVKVEHEKPAVKVEAFDLDDNTEDLKVNGNGASIKKVRSLEYAHNATSFNQNINNYGKLRSSQWKYYWFDKTGGYSLVKKNLKKKALQVYEKQQQQQQQTKPQQPQTNLETKPQPQPRPQSANETSSEKQGFGEDKSTEKSKEEKEGEIKPIEGPYFKYTIVPKSHNRKRTNGQQHQKPNDLVELDLNEDSDSEVIDEKVTYLPLNYPISLEDRNKLEKEKQQLLEEYKTSHTELQESELDLSKIEFQHMLKTKTVKRRRFNPNAVIS